MKPHHNPLYRIFRRRSLCSRPQLRCPPRPTHCAATAVHDVSLKKHSDLNHSKNHILYHHHHRIRTIPMYRLLLMCNNNMHIPQNHIHCNPMERMFRTRKLLQPATCSNYSYEGLGNRLVLCHNSAEPGSMRSVLLYFRAMKIWSDKKQSRLYSAVSPLEDVRLCQ